MVIRNRIEWKNSLTMSLFFATPSHKCSEWLINLQSPYIVFTWFAIILIRLPAYVRTFCCCLVFFVFFVLLNTEVHIYVNFVLIPLKILVIQKREVERIFGGITRISFFILSLKWEKKMKQQRHIKFNE